MHSKPNFSIRRVKVIIVILFKKKNATYDVSTIRIRFPCGVGRLASTFCTQQSKIQNVSLVVSKTNIWCVDHIIIHSFSTIESLNHR